MADTRTPEQRRRIMQAVKTQDTGPERIVRQILHRLGYRYRLHCSILPGKPDIVFAWLGGAIWKSLPLASVFTRAKRIAAFRGDVREQDLKRFARVLRHAVARADAVTVTTPSLRAGALDWGAIRDRISYIPNGVDLPSV